MDVHKNASLTPRGREAMVRTVVDEGATQAEAARLIAMSKLVHDQRGVRGCCQSFKAKLLDTAGGPIGESCRGGLSRKSAMAADKEKSERGPDLYQQRNSDDEREAHRLWAMPGEKCIC